MEEPDIAYAVRGEVGAEELSALLHASSEDESRPSSHWPGVLEHSLTWVTARRGQTLVGIVRVAWDGGVHSFLLDPTVHPSMRRRGIGTVLVRMVTEEARGSGAEWLHVDYEPHLTGFYAACGFRPTRAGLIRLR